MKKELSLVINSSTIVSVVAIIAMAICCLAAMSYNAKITIEKEKIEVESSNSNPEH